MMEMVAKSKMKAHCLEYFRQVEHSGQELIITDRGKPILKVVPYASNPAEILESLRGSVIRYDDPTEPVAVEDWEALK
jgi:prevent-host-death family protein